MWIVYQVGVALALALAGPVLLVRRGRHYVATLPGRLGRHHGPTVRQALWLHAVSVGEVGVAATLARALPPDLPLLTTTVTPTGQERARTLLASRGAVAYLPFDLGFAVGRFLLRFSPRALVLVEGDYWPLVLRAAKAQGLPVAVVNGRVSDRSFARMHRLRRLLGPVLSRVDRFGVQTAGDREKLLALGVEASRVTVTGNLKFETPEPPRHRELEAAVGRLAGERPVLVAGSTMPGEEEQVLRAFAEVGPEGALLVLAPRHPERWEAVARLVAEAGLSALRRSSFASGPAGGPPPAVLLLDSLGELAGLYRLARGAFIGGTLVPTGGHNPLEAARFAVPVAVGPSMDNFRDMAEGFDAAGAWQRVADASELGRVFARWIAEPGTARDLGERGAGLIAANRGALDKTLEVLAPLLERLAGDPTGAAG